MKMTSSLNRAYCDGHRLHGARLLSTTLEHGKFLPDQRSIVKNNFLFIENGFFLPQSIEFKRDSKFEVLKITRARTGIVFG